MWPEAASRFVLGRLFLDASLCGLCVGDAARPARSRCGAVRGGGLLPPPAPGHRAFEGGGPAAGWCSSLGGRGGRQRAAGERERERERASEGNKRPQRRRSAAARRPRPRRRRRRRPTRAGLPTLARPGREGGREEERRLKIYREI